jgi:hypothetical protein
MIPRLDKKWGIDHNNGLRIFLPDGLYPAAHLFFDSGMENSIQLIPLFGIGEDLGRQSFPMNGTIFLEDFLPKYPDQFFPGGCSGPDQLPGDLICIDEVSALFFQYLGDNGLPACHASRQSDH